MNQNQIQKKYFTKKSSLNLDEISIKNVLKNIINNEITNDSKIERKASEYMKNKESIQNNISIIWNNYLLNKDINCSNNQINNSSINNIKNQIISDDIDKSINNDQRNHSNIPNLDYLQNNKKKSYHSFITEGSSKDLTKKKKIL